MEHAGDAPPEDDGGDAVIHSSDEEEPLDFRTAGQRKTQPSSVKSKRPPSANRSSAPKSAGQPPAGSALARLLASAEASVTNPNALPKAMPPAAADAVMAAATVAVPQPQTPRPASHAKDRRLASRGNSVGPKPSTPSVTGPSTLATQAPADGGFQWAGMDQIRRLQEENLQLLQQLDDRNERLEELEARLQESSADQVEDALPNNMREAASKIQALGKKNRELQASANAHKAKATKLTKKIGELEYAILGLEREVAKERRKVQRFQAQSDGDVSSVTPSSPHPDSSQSDKKESEKLSEYRSEIQTLKKHLQTALNALEKELGDSVPLTVILNGESNWKGRAEQIALLKAKVLTEYQGDRSGRTSMASQRSTMRAGANDARQREALRELEAKRKQELDAAQSQAASLQEDHDRLKIKHSNLRTRYKTVSEELKSLRAADADHSAKQLELQEQIVALEQEKEEQATRLRTLEQEHSKPRVQHVQGDSAASAQQIKHYGPPQVVEALLHHFQLVQDAEAQARVAEIERDRFRELHDVYKRDLEAVQQALLDAQLQLKQLRLRAAPTDVGNSDAEVLAKQVELAREELHLQKAAHQRELQRRQDEVNLLHTTMGEIKRVFAQAVKKLKTSAA
ncbi:uncharacterized protein MONBRDRAFT_29914 [Monosiga brevicollis MX1]|uniref:Uncharacterized protein n=1 Tax=Monosiga brevicollis TaxID=81824 RepID=A9VCH6_MONBE|nr:uncharacterized protein MONBRDRAFT_29914 [Monosiga brevicollis MX1]EDQ84753.1 predicted protein [Monosiga brevicollis MX1]|eukprot:XP_001750403.1 hypothetical protein [Monosiga brevicollis MX1]